jgi:hypothetical protein
VTARQPRDRSRGVFCREIKTQEIAIMSTESDSSTAVKIVQSQLDAYNARDIESFMECWDSDAEYFEFPANLLARGADAIRARHVARFQEPGLFGRLLHRMCVGNLVVDHEQVRRSFPAGSGHVEVIAMYEVANGRIARAWFRIGEPVLDGEAG